MTDVWPLFGLLFLLYLAEGLWWAPVEAVVFSRGLWGRFRWLAPLPLRRDARAGGVPPRHLLSAGRRFLGCEWPISVSPEGVAAPGVEIPFAAARSFATAGPRLLHRKRAFARAASPREARELMRWVRKLSESDRRSEEIVEAIDRTFDDREARRRARRLRWALRRTRWLPGALFANLFVLGPVLLATLGESAWPISAAIHLALASGAAIVFARVDRKLVPERDDRFTTVLTLLLFPPAAARYADLLSRDSMAGLHPLAIAAALDGRLAEELARRAVLQSRRGSPARGENEIAAWFHTAFEARLLAAVERYGLDPRVLGKPPRPDAGAVAYCPLCLAQYRSQPRNCADCEGIALVPLS